MRCDRCFYIAKSKAGLASHRRWKHGEAAPERKEAAGPNATACEQTLAELDRMGRLERVDAARVQAVRSMAAALDAKPFNAQMWREYREALGALTVDDGDSGVDDLLDQLSAPVRHS